MKEERGGRNAATRSIDLALYGVEAVDRIEGINLIYQVETANEY